MRVKQESSYISMCICIAEVKNKRIKPEYIYKHAYTRTNIKSQTEYKN